MIRIFTFMLLCSFGVTGQIQETDAFNALNSWGGTRKSESKKGTKARGSRASDPQNSGTKTGVEENCSGVKDQTSVPYAFFLGLLADKKIEVSQNPQTGRLEIDGGEMIGNCNSMLETVVSHPNSDIPFYTFQLAVKKPVSCRGDYCDYSVSLVSERGQIKTELKKFQPNFSGFIDCLNETGVIEDGELVASKIRPVDYRHQELGVRESSELVYASRGFKGARYSGVHSTNRLPEYSVGCYYFEDIHEGGYHTYSPKDLEVYEKEKEFQKICSSQDYEMITQKMTQFNEFEEMKRELERVRRELVLEEVKNLQEIITESSDLSDVDSQKFQRVTRDFLEYVIKPLKHDMELLQKIYSNPGRSDKQEILVELYGERRAQELMAKSPREIKQFARQQMEEKAGVIVSYAKSPYLSKESYQKMLDPSYRPQLGDPTWISAALNLYEIQNTAFNYGRYNEGFWQSHYVNSGRSGEKRFESASVLNRRIAAKVNSRKEELRRVNLVVSQPEVNRVTNYEKTKARALASIDERLKRNQQRLMEAYYKVQTQCQAEKARKYWINQRACIRDAQEVIEVCSREQEELMNERQASIERYDGMIRRWQEARAQAGMGGFQTSVGQNRNTAGSASGSNTFTFQPTMPEHTSVDSRYSQQFMQPQMHQPMWQQQFSPPNMMGPQQQYGMGNSMNAGFMMGMNYGAGPASMMMNNYNPSPMSQFNQGFTGPGGSFSFAPPAAGPMMYGGGF